MCLGKNIRYLRKKRGLSQEQLADKLGYKSFTTIQKWESGVAEPSVMVVKKLADMFNVNMVNMTTVDIEAQENGNQLGEKKSSGYYVDGETAEVAQKIMDNPELKLLFEDAANTRPEDLETVHQMLLALKRKEQGG